MRIWSLHPKYLDTKGLVALWRETLLAQHVLAGKTKAYKNHPQLIRFKRSENPSDLINQYLAEVYEEATKRGYNFNRDKIDWNYNPAKIDLTQGQLDYEVLHLLNKLKTRDLIRLKKLKKIEIWDSHPIFNIVPGKIEEWEIILRVK